MRKTIYATRIMLLCAFAVSIFASCSRQTAYNSLHSDQLQAQQLPVRGNNEPVIAMQKTAITSQEVVSGSEIKEVPVARTKTVFGKQKGTILKEVKSKLIASTTKKAIKSTVQNNFSLAMHTAKMGAKADPDNGLAAVGVIFLVLGILSFVIPPLFFIGLTASAAQSLVIVAIALAVLGLLFLATGLARKAEKP